jgi:DnaA family protein
VEGPNALARHWVETVSNCAQPRTVYLWGPAGSGKTHLLSAACRAARDQGIGAAYVPLSRQAEVEPRMLAGLEAGCGLVCIDDLQAVAGQPAWERALFRLLIGLGARGGGLLAAGSTAPGALGVKLPDLASRLGADLVVRLQVLDEVDRVRALQRRAAEQGFALTDDVAAFLLSRFPRDLHSLFALLDRLGEASLAAGRRVTVPFVRDLLAASAGAGPGAQRGT